MRIGTANSGVPMKMMRISSPSISRLSQRRVGFPVALQGGLALFLGCTVDDEDPVQVIHLMHQQTCMQAIGPDASHRCP